ncbi:MAG TPA: AbrB/MazE/SpoVT family DNA-binding domain-containing protein [Candidatus Acidoferrum sp.]|nr:AbrB/MazE/SpoVT family DNA-binding domain-containing protein [Candidatus Acidoferrum sp.]
MLMIKITAKRQATFPAKVLSALGVKPGDRIALEASPQGFLLRPRHVDHGKLAPLRSKLVKGKGRFDLDKFRNSSHDPKLRD